jgi:hypothetical protein
MCFVSCVCVVYILCMCCVYLVYVLCVLCMCCVCVVYILCMCCVYFVYVLCVLCVCCVCVVCLVYVLCMSLLKLCVLLAESTQNGVYSKCGNLGCGVALKCRNANGQTAEIRVSTGARCLHRRKDRVFDTDGEMEIQTERTCV